MLVGPLWYLLKNKQIDQIDRNIYLSPFNISVYLVHLILTQQYCHPRP